MSVLEQVREISFGLSLTIDAYRIDLKADYLPGRNCSRASLCSQEYADCFMLGSESKKRIMLASKYLRARGALVEFPVAINDPQLGKLWTILVIN